MTKQPSQKEVLCLHAKIPQQGRQVERGRAYGGPRCLKR